MNRHDVDVFKCGTKEEYSCFDFYYFTENEYQKGENGYRIDMYGIDTKVTLRLRKWARGLHGNAPSGTPYADFYFTRYGTKYHGILYV